MRVSSSYRDSAWLRHRNAMTAQTPVPPPPRRSADPIDVHVGNRVRLRRTELKMTQARLSRFVGVSFQQIQKYENGSNRIGAGRLQVIARVLRVPTSFFFEGTPQTEAPPDTSSAAITCNVAASLSSFLHTREAARLNRYFARIADVTVRQRLIVLVRAIAVFGERGPPRRARGPHRQ